MKLNKARMYSTKVGTASVRNRVPLLMMGVIGLAFGGLDVGAGRFRIAVSR